MVVDPPGQKYIIDQHNPYTRIPDDAFPEPVSLDLDDVADCPDGWLLRTLTIGYYEDGRTYVAIRFGEGESYREFENDSDGRIVDMDWDGKADAWNVEWAVDDFESGFDELEWTRLATEIQYQDALRVARDYMRASENTDIERCEACGGVLVSAPQEGQLRCPDCQELRETDDE